MTHSLEPTDRRILDLIQHDFPLVPRPFRWIAERCDTTEADVISRLERLKQADMVRDICGVFDSARLGYRSTLATMAVAPERLEVVAAILNACPAVSHNYEREHEFNLWFTMTVPGDRSIDAEVADLARRAGVEDYLVLPARRRFKIGVDLDLGTRGAAKRGARRGVESGAGWQPAKKFPLFPSEEDLEESSFEGEAIHAVARPSGRDKSPTEVGTTYSALESAIRDPQSTIRNAVRLLQFDIPLEPQPFARLAAQLGIGEEELLAIARQLQAAGILRRIGAVLRHRHVGYAANGMAAWEIPAERIEAAGRIGAAERAVSHCYERPAFPPRWPYNFFTMIHGRREEEVRAIVERLRSRLQPLRCAVLFSRREFKKQRVRYFLESSL